MAAGVAGATSNSLVAFGAQDQSAAGVPSDILRNEQAMLNGPTKPPPPSSRTKAKRANIIARLSAEFITYKDNLNDLRREKYGADQRFFFSRSASCMAIG